jgi:hypothetical protein
MKGIRLKPVDYIGKTKIKDYSDIHLQVSIRYWRMWFRNAVSYGDEDYAEPMYDMEDIEYSGSYAALMIAQQAFNNLHSLVIEKRRRINERHKEYNN